MKAASPKVRTRAGLLPLALCCYLAAAASAMAQQVSPAAGKQTETEAARKAEKLIDEALELRRRGNDAAALDKLLRALKLNPTPRAKAQVAMAEQALGRWVEAEKHMLQALATPQDPWIRKRLSILQSALETVRQRLGLLQIAGVPDGATIYIADDKVGTAPLKKSIRVVAGEVSVRVEAPGHRTFVGVAKVEPGLLTRHVVTMIPLKQATENEPPASQPAAEKSESE